MYAISVTNMLYDRITIASPYLFTTKSMEIGCNHNNKESFTYRTDSS